MVEQNEKRSAGKPWSREIIRALKAVEDDRSYQLKREILNRLEADDLVEHVEHYEITERGEGVLNGKN